MATYSIISSVIIYFFIGITVCNSQTLNTEETKLYDMIMEYRASYGLPKIPLSKELNLVARIHVKDLVENKPDTGHCNAHSWSNKGKWTPVCYTEDHYEWEKAAKKPKELTNYSGYGVEIAVGDNKCCSDFVMSADYAINSWKESPPHNIVILNLNKWKDYKWKAIGISIMGGFSCVWFGEYEK